MIYKTKKLNGFQLNGKGGEIGKVKDFLFDDKYWTIRYLVADTRQPEANSCAEFLLRIFQFQEGKLT